MLNRNADIVEESDIGRSELMKVDLTAMSVVYSQAWNRACLYSVIPHAKEPPEAPGLSQRLKPEFK
jgi:hypothetical protein